MLRLNEGVKSEADLLQFLVKAKPVLLIMKPCKMSPNFLDELPKRCQFIREFVLDLTRIKTTSKLEFIFKMRDLVCLCAYNFYSFAFLEAAVCRNRSLRDLSIGSEPYSLKLDLRESFKNELYVLLEIKEKGKMFPNKQALIDFLHEVEPQLNDQPLAKFYDLLTPSNNFWDMEM